MARAWSSESWRSVDEGAKRFALDERHRVVEQLVAGLARAEHGDDARMMQTAGDLDLALEAVDVDAGGEIGGEDLHDNAPAERGIVGDVYLRHPAATALAAE